MLGPGGGALRSSRVYTSIYRQMSIILYLICDTDRSRIGVGSRGGGPGDSGVLGNRLRSDKHAWARLRAPGGVEGVEPRKLRGFRH